NRQRLEDVADRAERAFHTGNHRIEIVEGADRDPAHRAALRCSGIDVVEVLEVRRILDVSEQRKAVGPRGLACGGLLRMGFAQRQADSSLQERGGGNESAAAKK